MRPHQRWPRCHLQLLPFIQVPSWQHSKSYSVPRTVRQEIRWKGKLRWTTFSALEYQASVEIVYILINKIKFNSNSAVQCATNKSVKIFIESVGGRHIDISHRMNHFHSIGELSAFFMRFGSHIHTWERQMPKIAAKNQISYCSERRIYSMTAQFQTANSLTYCAHLSPNIRLRMHSMCRILGKFIYFKKCIVIMKTVTNKSISSCYALPLLPHAQYYVCSRRTTSSAEHVKQLEMATKRWISLDCLRGMSADFA